MARIAGIPGDLAQFYGAVCPSSPRSISISSDDSDQDSSHQSHVEAHHTCLQMMTKSTLRSTRRKRFPNAHSLRSILHPRDSNAQGKTQGLPRTACTSRPSAPIPNREKERERAPEISRQATPNHPITRMGMKRNSVGDREARTLQTPLRIPYPGKEEKNRKKGWLEGGEFCFGIMTGWHALCRPPSCAGLQWRGSAGRGDRVSVPPHRADTHEPLASRDSTLGAAIKQRDFDEPALDNRHCCRSARDKERQNPESARLLPVFQYKVAS